MSENPNSDEILVNSTSLPEAKTTAGKLLKEARLHAGVHLAVLSVALKVPVRQLEALEADQYQSDQSPVFARGLASSVCRQLRVDPAPILALLPQAANYLEPNGLVRQANVAPANLGRMSRSSAGLSARALWAAVGMVVLIAALIWLPSPAHWAWLDELAAYLSTPTVEVRTVTSEPEVMPLASNASEAAALGAVSVVPSAPAAVLVTPTVVASTIGAVQNPPSVAQEIPKTHATMEIASAPELLFTATDTSWIEVRDTKNQMIWNGVLKSGETKNLQTPASVNVAIGQARAIQVSIKGQAFDLKPFTKANVARFEVKP